MQTIVIPFIRIERQAIDAIQIIEVTATSADNVITNLMTAITKWVEQTASGHAAWKASSKNLNIGDFIDQFDPAGNAIKPELAKHLREFGIHTVKSLFSGEPRDFDKVLANPTDSEE